VIFSYLVFVELALLRVVQRDALVAVWSGEATPEGSEDGLLSGGWRDFVRLETEVEVHDNNYLVAAD